MLEQHTACKACICWGGSGVLSGFAGVPPVRRRCAAVVDGCQLLLSPIAIKMPPSCPRVSLQKERNQVPSTAMLVNISTLQVPGFDHRTYQVRQGGVGSLEVGLGMIQL